MKYGEEQVPDNRQFSGSIRKWIAGAALPTLLLLYGIWVILPPHFSGRHVHGSNAFMWTLIALAWGAMAISVALMCFCFYFFEGMTSWAWVEVLFVVSSITLATSGFSL